MENKEEQKELPGTILELGYRTIYNSIEYTPYNEVTQCALGYKNGTPITYREYNREGSPGYLQNAYSPELQVCPAPVCGLPNTGSNRTVKGESREVKREVRKKKKWYEF